VEKEERDEVLNWAMGNPQNIMTRENMSSL